YGNYNYQLDQFKDVVSRFAKIKRNIFEQRGYDENANLDTIKEEMQTELALLEVEFEEIRSEDFYEKMFKRIQEKKESLSIRGGSLNDKVKDFGTLNHLLSYKYKNTDLTKCEIPLKTLNQEPKEDKSKKIKIYKEIAMTRLK